MLKAHLRLSRCAACITVIQAPPAGMLKPTYIYLFDVPQLRRTQFVTSYSDLGQRVSMHRLGGKWQAQRSQNSGGEATEAGHHSAG